MAVRARGPKQPDNTDIEVGRRVRIERIARGLSQSELANQIGVTFQQLHKYESGQNRISMGRLMLIGRALGVDMAYLLWPSNQTSAAQPNLTQRAELSEAMRMLGRTGALRLLRSFVAIPATPARLRNSIVDLVERVAADRVAHEEPERGRSSNIPQDNQT
jgi:transcriptional regulator with XRE-family HTH domain